MRTYTIRRVGFDAVEVRWTHETSRAYPLSGVETLSEVEAAEWTAALRRNGYGSVQ